MREHDPSILRGAIAGVLAGAFASYAMNRFQAAVAALDKPSPGGGDDPATVKAAQRLAGRPIPKDRKSAAGNQVHYAFGSFLGGLYGVATEVAPPVATGFGMPYGVAVALVADEAAIPALRLSGPPWSSPLLTHAYSLASHLIFGAALEGARRVLVRAL